MTISLEEEYTLDLGISYGELAELVVNAALDYEACPYECEVNVILTDNDKIHEINKECRSIDAATDVLSFPMVEYSKAGCFDAIEEQQPECFHPESGELMLGDIIISLDKMKDQALGYGHSYQREFAFLIAHSMLHLMGYDHMEPEEEKVMFAKQEEILRQLGITR
ncbi:MAG: rRNA maturation RNase YbeY [Lachnospiraceae bacterium]|nr:rRNA maturation RNase YbeY [Lachnospiraceae bacterium]